MSEDLHDHAIQNVLTARQDVADAAAGDTCALGRADHALRLALDQLRSSVRELHPYLLDHLDLPSALHAISDQLVARGGYQLAIHVDPAAVGQHGEFVLSLARELLANATNHANASRVTVTLARSDHAVILEVADNGRGVTEDDRTRALGTGHVGLASSRERVEATAGSFEVSSQPGAGARVRCVIRDEQAAKSADRQSVDREIKSTPHL